MRRCGADFGADIAIHQPIAIAHRHIKALAPDRTVKGDLETPPMHGAQTVRPGLQLLAGAAWLFGSRRGVEQPITGENTLAVIIIASEALDIEMLDTAGIIVIDQDRRTVHFADIVKVTQLGLPDLIGLRGRRGTHHRGRHYQRSHASPRSRKQGQCRRGTWRCKPGLLTLIAAIVRNYAAPLHDPQKDMVDFAARSRCSLALKH